MDLIEQLKIKPESHIPAISAKTDKALILVHHIYLSTLKTIIHQNNLFVNIFLNIYIVNYNLNNIQPILFEKLNVIQYNKNLQSFVYLIYCWRFQTFIYRLQMAFYSIRI